MVGATTLVKSIAACAVIGATIGAGAHVSGFAGSVDGPAGGDLAVARRIAPPAEPPGPQPTNAVLFAGRTVQLTHGFEEAFRYRPETRGDTHSVAEFSVADDQFVPLVIVGPLTGTLTIWRPADATVWVDADLGSPGGGGVQRGTFTLARLDDSRARLGFDLELDSGATVTGSFEGSFPLFDNNLTP